MLLPIMVVMLLRDVKAFYWINPLHPPPHAIRELEILANEIPMAVNSSAICLVKPAATEVLHRVPPATTERRAGDLEKPLKPMLKLPRNEKSVILLKESDRLGSLPSAVLGVVRGDIDICDVLLDHVQVLSREEKHPAG